METFDTLIAKLDHIDCDVRRRAVKALGKRREKNAIPHLLKILENDHWFNVRSAAWSALKKIDPHLYNKVRKEAGLTMKQLFFKSGIAIPYWTGFIIWLSPILLSPLPETWQLWVEKNIMVPYLGPIGFILIAVGFLLILFFGRGKIKLPIPKTL